MRSLAIFWQKKQKTKSLRQTVQTVLAESCAIFQDRYPDKVLNIFYLSGKSESYTVLPRSRVDIYMFNFKSFNTSSIGPMHSLHRSISLTTAHICPGMPGTGLSRITNKTWSFLRTELANCSCPFSRPVVCRNTISPLAQVLRPPNKNGQCPPLPLYIVVSVTPITRCSSR